MSHKSLIEIQKPEPVELEAPPQDLALVDLDREAYTLALEAGAVACPTVDVVLVTHNSRADLERNFVSLERAARHAGARIIVADNGSTDGSLQFCLGRPQPGVDGIALLENRGLATAVNAAATVSTADYLVVMHPDVMVPETAIVDLVSHLEANPIAAVAAPRLRHFDGRIQSSARTVPNVGTLLAAHTHVPTGAWGQRQLQHYLAAPEPESGHARVEWASSAMLAIRRRDFDRVNGWDDAFHMHLVDVDFGARMRAAGRQVHYVPAVECVHERSHTGHTRDHLKSAARFYAKQPGYALRGLVDVERKQQLSNAVRRIVDVAVSATMLVLFAPIFALIALAVRLDDGAPMIFRQTRLGKNGRTFTMYKFRTMRVGSDRDVAEAAVRRHMSGAVEGELDGRPIYKLWPDPRHTRVGAYLRRWSLDELPQLYNVLKGDMTLVGFRPPIPDEVEQYPQWYFDRFAVKPGITGLWQVSGRNERTYEEMVVFDLEYQTRRSLRLDFALMLRTPLVVLLRRGAV
jgi:lipopolysaccharide/colanic/teichoic acid biosynthesis glycosyltransferase